METNIHAKSHDAARSALTKPISIRLTQEEYQQLNADAGDLSLSEYIRRRLFNGDLETLDNNSSDYEQRLTPQIRQKQLAQILIRLGQLQVANEVSGFLAAIHSGLIEAPPEFISKLQALHNEIQNLRIDLLKALGLRPSQPQNK